MSLIFKNGVLLFRDLGAGPLLAKDEACCCCTCDSLPDTLYGILSRDAGDWSGCTGNEWQDGEQFTLTKQVGTLGSTCGDVGSYQNNSWQGALACGDTIEICCDEDFASSEDGELRLTMWWCDPSQEKSEDSICNSRQFVIAPIDRDFGSPPCCCDTQPGPISFSITFYLDDPSP